MGEGWETRSEGQVGHILGGLAGWVEKFRFAAIFSISTGQKQGDQGGGWGRPSWPEIGMAPREGRAAGRSRVSGGQCPQDLHVDGTWR